MEDSVFIGLIAAAYSIILLVKVWQIASNSSKQVEISSEILRRSKSNDSKSDNIAQKKVGFGFASDDQLIQYSGKK
jgi:hypothetical protein